MRPIILFIVKPHPPSAIVDGASPVPESYRYNWDPISLKYMASAIQRSFGSNIRIKIWHLMDRSDDGRFLLAVENEYPSIIAFSEIDILVNEVNALSEKIKLMLPGIWTVVGGKQTSLLKTGDRFPFRHMDYAFRGDGTASLVKLVRSRLAGTTPEDLPGLVPVSDDGFVVGPSDVIPRMDITSVDALDVRSVAVEERSLSDYLERYQTFPTIGRDDPKTASILIGSGCPHACYVCQSPIEYGDAGKVVMVRKADDVAREIVWLRERHEVNSFFSLESNLSLGHLRDLYTSLESYGIRSLSLSGFVRASDVVKAGRNGMLRHLAAKGLRVLSIGLDVSSSAEGDIYNKSFTYQEQLECLNTCEQLGIIVLATAIASPDVDRYELAAQLQELASLAAAEVDVRLAIALRNTPYYRLMEGHLLYHPDNDSRYYDRQNYRYQTIQIPGKITPDETYELIRQFYANYHGTDRHVEYVLRMVKKHPDTLPFFQRQYRGRSTKHLRVPLEIRNAVLTV